MADCHEGEEGGCGELGEDRDEELGEGVVSDESSGGGRGLGLKQTSFGTESRSGWESIVDSKVERGKDKRLVFRLMN